MPSPRVQSMATDAWVGDIFAKTSSDLRSYGRALRKGCVAESTIPATSIRGDLAGRPWLRLLLPRRVKTLQAVAAPSLVQGGFAASLIQSWRSQTPRIGAIFITLDHPLRPLGSGLRHSVRRTCGQFPAPLNLALGRWASPFGLNPTCELQVNGFGLRPPARLARLATTHCVRFAPARRLSVLALGRQTHPSRKAHTSLLSTSPVVMSNAWHQPHAPTLRSIVPATMDSRRPGVHQEQRVGARHRP